jgi:putative salt-induced outer membrane protein
MDAMRRVRDSGRVEHAVVACLAFMAAGIAFADDAPPPQGWSGKGELGFVDAKGNTNADTFDAKLSLSDQIGPWKHTVTVDDLSAKSAGITSANRKDAAWQSNYDLTKADFVFGGLSYIDDQFSGFAYQANATVGYGRKFIDSAATKLTAQLGVGYGQLQPYEPLLNAEGVQIGQYKGETERTAVLQGEAKYEQVLTSTTKLTNDLKFTYASVNTYIEDDLAASVKISTKLSLSVAYAVRHNTSPPPDSKATDTLTTVNLVYAF